MNPMYSEQVATMCKQSSWLSAVERRPSVRQLLALACAALSASGCGSAEPNATTPAEVGVHQHALFANGDFESGPAGQNTPTSWTVTPYLNPTSVGVTRQTPQTRAGLNLQSGGSAQNQTLYAAGGAESEQDSVLDSSATLRWPKYGNYAAYLNSVQGDSRNVNSLKQTMTLGVNDVDPYDGKPHVRFAVAPVLENPGHPANQQPYYFVQVKNVTTDEVLYVDYNASAEPGIPWYVDVNGIYYTDWQLKDIAPTSTQATLGDQIELEVIAAACSQGAHFGRVYVDGVGPAIPGLSVTGVGPAAANAGSDITYTLAFKNGGNGTAGNVALEFNTPPRTTFQSVTAPGAVCTQPPVGIAGLVSCIYGLVDPGENGSLQVTVKIDPTATGTITAGNYKISANNASDLLGSKIYTTVTSNVSYADVTISNSNGVGAVDWNQALTYRIVASNGGPSAITGGTVVDTFPAELTNVGWTCTGASGGSCTASGTGNLNDSAVNLPVGGSVTYVVSATTAASGAATRVSNTASFTMPGGFADPQPSDNADADVDPITTTYTLTVNKAGTATGDIVSVPNAINCDSTCSSQAGTFASGATMILAAFPAPGKVFAGWSGGCSGTANCSISLSSNTSVTATFNNPPPCALDTDCSSTRYCDGVSNTCLKRLANTTLIPNDGIHDGTCATGAPTCVSQLCFDNKCASHCSADSDCTADSYCDNTATFCVNKLPAASTIPSDGLHDGTCSSAPAVCQSGLCNTTTANTCGSANGAGCTANNECSSNSCKSSHCVPASGGCYVDSECAINQYCNRATLTCATKLNPGTAIPSDGLHGGSCTDAGAVCVSGQCNTTSSTCAQVDGNSCGAVNQCVSNTCTSSRCVPAVNGCYLDANCSSGNFCDRSTYTCTAKLAAGAMIPNDGLHTGVCANAAAVCLSAQCNTVTTTCAESNGSLCDADNKCVTNKCTSDRCVPASNGCYIDANCGSTQYCDRSVLTCTDKLSSGTLIPSDTLHLGTCSDALAVCQTGLCDTMTSMCVSSDGNTCSSGQQCASRTCTSTHCVPDTNGCWVDEDCASGKYCDRDALTCADKLASGAGIPMTDGYHTGTCSDATAVCQSGICNSAMTTCGSNTTVSCSSPAQCASNVCDTNGMCGVMDGGSGCTSMNAAALCQSGTCASGHCVPAGGSGCWLDADCPSNTYCNRASSMCTAKLANGVRIPSDGLHDGSCNQTNAAATCQSGGCNPSSDTCGATNGASCSDADECIRDICGGNGKCGLENGTGPCTQGNAKLVCQSSTCSATANVCVAPSTQPCASDDDCTPQQYCDAFNSVCVPDLPNGSPLPSDVLHSGLCTMPVANAVCVSGVCNSSTQTCAAPLNANCTANADCTGGLCGSNGMCGGAAGQGPCTGQNQATTCQSGACSQDRTCLPSGGCNVDADCQPSGYCDGGANTCASLLPPGSPLPNDGDHDGTCPGSGLSAVCDTGRCSTQSNRCVAPNGANCSDDNACASGTCGSNGKCGVEDAGGPCTPGADATCQSGSCGAGSTCDAASSCSVDADCSGAGGFCQDGACTPKLPAGAPVPNDALHAGTCNSGNAAAVCVSGQCNATTSTCSAERGASCALPAQCTSDVCGIDGKCGFPNGSGPCTGGNATTLCQSGVCSTGTSTCTPSGGCAQDSECNSGEYCDGSTFMCVTKRGSGTPIPSDGIHDGRCTMANAAVCSSDACNPVSNTCAVDNGMPCASNGECVTNVCGGDGECGLPNSAGPCTPIHSNACRSNVCSATSLTCIPPGGCGNDNECDDSNYCDGVTHQCVTRKADGENVPASVNAGECPDSGLTRSCASGQCSPTSDDCVSPNGGSCSSDDQCLSGVCGSNGKCGREDSGACTPGQDAVCQSGSCDASLSTCDSPAACTVDADCQPAGYCDGSACRAKKKPGSSLPQDSLHGGTCTSELAQLVCDSGACNESTDTCAAEFNAPCATGAACVANVCGSDGKCGLPIGEGTCNNLNAAIRCRTQLCSAAGVCLPELGSGCAVDADCTSGNYCKRDTYQCIAKLADGTAIPDDGLHDGQCSDQAAALVCASGACNTSADTCARPNGTTCSGPFTCISNTCGDNGKCGIEEGAGTCTAQTPDLCQTGRCSPSTGKCIDLTLGCAVDADCDDTRYCAPEMRTCVTKLAAGGTLPTDSLHSGACSTSLAAAVCQTAECNPQTNTCAAENSASCSSASQCVSNVCGDNQKCGRAVGQSGCSAASQTLDCQTGFCAQSGSCVPPAGCQEDMDCPDGAYCNRTAHACAPKLKPGSPLPSDGLHDGSCDRELAQAVCAAGACNPGTNTCAVSAPLTCTQPEQCVTGVCSENDQCGLLDGEGPCGGDAECQSGKCQPGVNRCIATMSGCTADTDCAPAQYCDRTRVHCEADLADGAPIPADSPSAGKCTVEVAMVVCASGACNPANDTCARLDGAECDDDTQCAAGSCRDGKCGAPGAGGECNEDNAGVVCESGQCETETGRCVTMTDGCKRDSDCSSGKYCDARRLTCAAKLSNGRRLPSDALHGEGCSPQTAKAVCESGECNETTDRCALALGEVCFAASECGSNACLGDVCVPTSKAPRVDRLSGGSYCSVVHVGQAAGGGGACLLLLTAAFGLVQRRRRSNRNQARRDR